MVLPKTIQLFPTGEQKTNLGQAHEQIQGQNASDPVVHSVK